jgi:hypothetical protein
MLSDLGHLVITDDVIDKIYPEVSEAALAVILKK